MFEQYRGQPIYLYGISPDGLSYNNSLGQSGRITIPVSGNIMGNIDGVAQSGGSYWVVGWACASGETTSVDVDLYLGGAGTNGGAWISRTLANNSSEAAVAQACGSTGAAYRFSVPISANEIAQYGGQPIYLYGISPDGRSYNNQLGQSGMFSIPLSSSVAQSAAAEITTGFSVLTVFQPACTESDPNSGACLSAAKRFCNNQGYASGFGPVEYNPAMNVAVVDCFGSASATIVQTTFAELTAYQPACNASVPFSIVCASGAKRFCNGQGYAAGYGPTEYNGSVAYVTCLKAPSSVLINGTFSSLENYQPGCDGESTPQTGACFSAVSRACQAQGYIGGTGVLENNGNTAVYACVK